MAEDRASIGHGAYSKHHRQKAVGKRIERDPRDANPLPCKSRIKDISECSPDSPGLDY